MSAFSNDRILQLLRMGVSPRLFALNHLADQARAELEAAPPFEPGPVWLAHISNHGGKVPKWDLTTGEGVNGVAALLLYLGSSEDKKAAQWHAAAMVLRHCLLYQHRPADMPEAAIQVLIGLAGRYHQQRAAYYDGGQVARAQKERQKSQVTDLIKKIQRNHPDDSAKAVFDQLLGDLDAEGMNPVEGMAGKYGDKLAIFYDTEKGRKTITLATITNKLAELKNNKHD